MAQRQRLAQVFGNRVVALYHDVEWPPRSVDLTPFDLFLWSYLKSRVFATPPLSVIDLIANTELAFEKLPELILLEILEIQ